jgi:hypothetical protein
MTALFVRVKVTYCSIANLDHPRRSSPRVSKASIPECGFAALCAEGL